MHGVRVPEQVVEIAEDLLIGAHQEHAEVVGRAREPMQRQRPPDAAAIDELIDLAVGIAGDVAQHAHPVRPLVQPMDRHDREELLDRPAVGHRLKEREVAEIGVGQRLVEALEVFGQLVQRLGELPELHADRPIQVLGERALLERQIAAREQVHRHVERLLGVVVALQRVAGGQAVVGLDQVDQRLFHLGRRGLGHVLVAKLGHVEHVHDEEAVIGDDRPAALRDDRRVGHLRLVAHGLQVIDHVVRVLFERVVHAGFEVGLRAVVVDARARRRRPCSAGRRRP